MARTFTLEEANALLPRLREILLEMQEKKPALDSLREELAGHSQTASGNGHLVGKEMAAKRKQADGLVERLNELLAEVTEIGCEMKGLEQGLIDFRAERDGRTVYLCWRLGESEIGFWHELDHGFAGREPL
ncbi:MAG: DUF2203 domain-containing protein [Dehalococcoidia bacterium]